MKKPETELHIISTPEDWQEMVRYVDGEDFATVAFDLETDSVVEKRAAIYGVGLCFQPGQAFYIPYRNPDSTLAWSDAQALDIHSTIDRWLKSKQIIGHNVVYDVLVWEGNGGSTLDEHIIADTILMKHMVDEEPPFGLKETAVAYLGPWADKALETLKLNVISKGGRWTEDNKDMYLADTAVLGEYCGWDVLLTRWLFDIFSVKIKEQNLETLFYEEEVMPLYKEVTINMKRQGFRIDVAHFEALAKELRESIATAEAEVQEAIAPFVSEFCDELVAKECPVKRTGRFPAVLAEQLGIPLPVAKKTGKTTLAKAAVAKMAESHPEHANFYAWLAEEIPLGEHYETRAAQLAMFFDGLDRDYVFNLGSNAHLGWLFFEKLQLEPLSRTEGGKPQCDDDFLATVATRLPWVEKLLDYKRLNKLLSTYVEGILERQVDGTVYASMLQFGTTSGRFSCRSPNLQNLPRIKEDDSGMSPIVLKYANAIKRGFVAPEGYVIVNTDYSSLEPRCFASASGDPLLQQVFFDDLDLYSQVAIRTFSLEGVSASKKDDNYLGNVSKEKRQLAKTIALAIPYGAEAGRISQILNISWQEANEIVENYLSAFPELKKYMQKCNYEAKVKGRVTTKFGRVRHLPHCMGLYKRYQDKLLDYRWVKMNGLFSERHTFKNALNNAKNFPIQGLAAHIVNRAMLAISREFKAAGIDGHIVAQVHDEITCIVKRGQEEQASAIIQKCMETTTTIAVPLVAEPQVSDNWADAK